MITINLKFNTGYKSYFENYPHLYDQMNERASKRTLEMWQERAFVRAPYKTGTLRREIRALYSDRRLVAGEYLSRPYALIQDKGGKAGRNYSVTIKPKHYFFKMAEESAEEVLKIYEEEVERILNG